MNVSDLLHGYADLAAKNPLLLLFTLIAVGSAIGALRWRGFSLGPAAVLFVALAFSAYDERLALPLVVGQLGLALFAYTIGVAAGPSFFTTVRSGGRAVLVAVAVLVGAALVTLGVGSLLGLRGPLLSGVYAGSLTNTPALAASLEQLKSSAPTVGYSVTYLFGVIGMLIAGAISLRTHVPGKAVVAAEGGAGEAGAGDEVPHLEQRTLRVDVEGLPSLGELEERYEHRVVFSRVMHGDVPGHPGTVDVASSEASPVVGDILTAVGDARVVDQVVQDLGHPSSVPLVLDRSQLDFRRITVSNRQVAGRSLGDLRLTRRFGATATRVRRGDVDLLATDDLVLQLGDRVRVVARREQMERVATLLGDSERGASDLNPVGFALGLTLGLLVGLLEVPKPGGGTFALGVAGGPLLVGLFLGRLQRTGRVLWTIPYQASTAVNQLGMLLFLAYAGSNAGHALSKALASNQGIRLFAVGFVVTGLSAVALLVAGPRLARATGAQLAGQVAGFDTQPAVLAYVSERSNADPRINLGYALIYPVAMIVKVILAPLLGTI
ncbi:MAG TPA: TrkA C-terminal domain-containing protein [Actinomycetes bacterium]|nr:TrkA C-terminal domain-containing protein [Actinomycetes bacterium]